MQRAGLRRPVYPPVRLSIRPSNAWLVTKRKKLMPTLLCHMKDLHPSFPTQRMVGGVHVSPLYLKSWAKLTLFKQKRRFSLVAPQP